VYNVSFGMPVSVLAARGSSTKEKCARLGILCIVEIQNINVMIVAN